MTNAGAATRDQLHGRRVGTGSLGHRRTDLLVVVVGAEPRPVGPDDGGHHPAERPEPALDLADVVEERTGDELPRRGGIQLCEPLPDERAVAAVLIAHLRPQPLFARQQPLGHPRLGLVARRCRGQRREEAGRQVPELAHRPFLTITVLPNA